MNDAQGDESAPAADNATGEKIGRGCGFGCLGVIVLLLVVVVWASTTDSSGGSGGPGSRGGAEVACENLVRDQLKSPSTAKFSNVQATGTGPWTVTGAVDSENSFGATLRSTWTCEVRSLGGDRYEGTVTFDGR